MNGRRKRVAESSCGESSRLILPDRPRLPSVSQIAGLEIARLQRQYTPSIA